MSSGAGEVVKGHCPDCGDGRNAFLRGKHKIERVEEDGSAWSETWFLLQCCGCERPFVRKDVWFSEWETIGEDPVSGLPRLEGGIETTYWPAPAKRKLPAWIQRLEEADRQIGNLLSEMYSALSSDLRVLAAIGARTVFDRASELLGVDPTLPFRRKLETLTDAGRIGKDEKHTLETLIDAGSAAAHRGWRPGVDALDTMVDVIESFLYRSFVLGDGIKKLRAAVPAKPSQAKP